MQSQFDLSVATRIADRAAFRLNGKESNVRNSLITKLLSGLLLSALMTVLPSRAQGQTAAPESLKLRVGDAAPDFKMQYFDGSDLKDVHLSDYHGKKNVVLAFYIFAFTGG
jgi:hypothetical protein